MTAIYPLESPGGWHLIGRTPLPLWDLRRDPPAMLGAGDKVTFQPVSLASTRHFRPRAPPASSAWSPRSGRHERFA